MVSDIKISEEPLDMLQCTAAVASPGSGAIDLFIGNVRDQTNGKPVLRLEFEAYKPMALQEMRKIAEKAREKWAIHGISLHHRTGILFPGDTAVIIAVSAAHRGAAFEACRFCIDELKKTVPIWKKEIFEDGETWVAAHP